MHDFLSFITTPEFTVGLLAFNALLLILIISLSARIGRLRKSIKRLFTGVNGGNLETIMNQLLDEMNDVRSKHSDQQLQMKRLSQKVSNHYGNLAILRYNAFGDVGSDLSFSFALLDDALNGVVITSIYGREESRIYAKPLQAGKSVYNLTQEEQAVIHKAAAAHR